MGVRSVEMAGVCAGPVTVNGGLKQLIIGEIHVL
jgi:hypothetical protein